MTFYERSMGGFITSQNINFDAPHPRPLPRFSVNVIYGSQPCKLCQFGKTVFEMPFNLRNHTSDII